MKPGSRPTQARPSGSGPRSDRVRRTVRYATLALTLMAATQASAQGRSAMLGVSAFVVASTHAETLAQSATLVVTAEDVRRGYVDAPAASRLRITSTSPAGFRLSVHPRLAMFRSVSVRLGSHHARLGADGGTLVAVGRTGRRVPVDVDYRFELAEGVAPGHYPWPLVLDARPM